jgi:hypothetical protein
VIHNQSTRGEGAEGWSQAFLFRARSCVWRAVAGTGPGSEAGPLLAPPVADEEQILLRAAFQNVQVETKGGVEYKIYRLML